MTSSELDSKAESSRWRLPTLRQSSLLMVSAAAIPARIWASNLVEIGFPDGLLLWCALVFATALIVWLIAARQLDDPDGVTYSVFWFVLGFSAVGPLADDVAGGATTLLVILCLAVWLTYRLRHVEAYRYFTMWSALTIALIPIGMLLSAATASDSTRLDEEFEISASEFILHPDVVLVVFDGHASLDTLKRDYGADFSSLIGAYESEGVSIASEMKANYTLTHMSLASILDMSYPLSGGVGVGEAEWSGLLNKVRGSNQLVDLFKSEGYRYVVVESGWLGFQCTSHADACVRGVWPDNATWEAMRRTLLRDVRLVKHSFASGSIRTLEWLEANLEQLGSNNKPDLVVAHVMLPHPPFYVDEKCAYRWLGDAGGSVVSEPQTSPETKDERRRYYLEQVECAQSSFLRLVRGVPEGTLVLGFSDHGPDMGGQLFKAPEDWSDADVVERFSIWFATNDESCGLSELSSAVNIGRALISCLSEDPVELLSDRYFIGVGSRRSPSSPPEPVLEVVQFPVLDSE